MVGSEVFFVEPLSETMIYQQFLDDPIECESELQLTTFLFYPHQNAKTVLFYLNALNTL